MKHNTLTKLWLFAAIIALFASCDDLFDGDDPSPKDEYITKYELLRSYTPSQLDFVIDLVKEDYPEISEIEDKFEYGVMIYKIWYNTTFQEENIQASGLVCVPIGEGPFPVLSYQNGTNTLHAEAPSVNPDRDLYRMLEFVASTGFIISIPDYIGFGATDDKFHPYLHEESTVHTVLDMLRAVDEMITNYDLNTSVANELYITGYSQGGWATMQVQKAIEEQFSNEFNLQASACAAGPYNLNTVNDYIMSQTSYPMPYYVGYMYNSYLNLELIPLSADEIFQEPFASKITTLFDGNMTGEEINDELTTTVADLFTADYLASYRTAEKYSSVVSSLEANSVEAWNTSTPTLIIHGTADEFVPFRVSSNIYEDFLSKGVSQEQVRLLPLEGEGHISGIIPAGLASVQWFLDLKNQN